jgi:hypothetical protein
MAVNINASAIDKVGPYAEEQLYLLCAKHALNNLLQEEKIGYYPKINSELVEPTGPIPAKGLLRKGVAARVGSKLFDIGVQLNIWKYCEVLDVLQQVEVRAPVDDIDKACSGPKRDNISFDRIPSIIKRLGYTVEEAREGQPNFWADLRTRLQDIKLLGIIINKGMWHYTAVSKFVKGCTRWERNATRRLVSKESYTFLDSYPKIKTVCKNLDDMITYLRTEEDVHAVIYVYDTERGYPSVAALRRRALDPASAHPSNSEVRAEGVGSVLSLAPKNNSRAQVVENYGRPPPNPKMVQLARYYNLDKYSRLAPAVKTTANAGTQGGRSTKRNRRRARRSTRRN